MIAPSEGRLRTDRREGRRKPKIRVRRMKESRDARGLSAGRLPASRRGRSGRGGAARGTETARAERPAGSGAEMEAGGCGGERSPGPGGGGLQGGSSFGPVRGCWQRAGQRRRCRRYAAFPPGVGSERRPGRGRGGRLGVPRTLLRPGERGEGADREEEEGWRKAAGAREGSAAAPSGASLEGLGGGGRQLPGGAVSLHQRGCCLPVLGGIAFRKGGCGAAAPRAGAKGEQRRGTLTGAA